MTNIPVQANCTKIGLRHQTVVIGKMNMLKLFLEVMKIIKLLRC